jgi:hypothetical protein
MARTAHALAGRLGLPATTLGVRYSLSGNLAFYQSLGYDMAGTGAHPGYREPAFHHLQKRLDARHLRDEATSSADR